MTRTEDGRPVRSLPDRVLGVLGGGMLIAAVVVLVGGGPGDGQSAESAPPTIDLVDATTAEPSGGLLRLEFRVDGTPLRWTSTGWGTNGMHVHAEIDGLEVMPARDDIEPVGDGGYVWVIAGAPQNVSTVRLVWSDAQHRPLMAGSSAPLEVRRDDSAEANGDGAR